MHTVRQILKVKGNEICSISPQAFAYEALELMNDKGVGALLVLDNEKLVGIFSERDYARKVILKGKSSKDTPVSELMTEEILYLEPQTTVDECMALMTDKRVRHMPVLENGELIGVVSIGDVVKQVISDQEVVIEQLEKYITGSY